MAKIKLLGGYIHIQYTIFYICYIYIYMLWCGQMRNWTVCALVHNQCEKAKRSFVQAETGVLVKLYKWLCKCANSLSIWFVPVQTNV